MFQTWEPVKWNGEDSALIAVVKWVTKWFKIYIYRKNQFHYNKVSEELEMVC